MSNVIHNGDIVQVFDQVCVCVCVCVCLRERERELIRRDKERMSSVDFFIKTTLRPSLAGQKIT